MKHRDLMIVRAAGHVISTTNKTLEYVAFGLSGPIVARAAFSILGSDRIRYRQCKVALKRAAEGWLPREIVYRPKASFSAPLRARVRNDLHELINDELVRGERRLALQRSDVLSAGVAA